MKRKSLLLVITGVAIAIIIALAFNIHMKLSAQNLKVREVKVQKY
jgi:hypothetical protein